MNGILVIDKPSGWTSHDVVAKLRGLLGQRRIGHGGTLDPMATGVLPIFVGRATRAVEFCESADKEYLAGLCLGITTDTQDITGTVLTETVSDVTAEELKAALKTFTGRQKQIPPMYSAVKIGGKKLYEIARRGGEIDRPPRDIVIHTLELVDGAPGAFMLRVVCSKGTYVRTLCHDIGAFLGVGGCLQSLNRVRAGTFQIDRAVTLDAVRELAEAGRARELLCPVDSLFAEYPALFTDREQEKKARAGASFFARQAPEGRLRVYSDTGEFLLLGRAENGKVTTVKSFFEV